MPLIEIKPYDNTFFRDGKPFSIGMSNHLESMNTPYTSTIWGAIFTAILVENQEFRNKFFNKKDYNHKKLLNIKNIFLFNSIKKQLFIKAPLDLFADEDLNIKMGKFEDIDVTSNFNFKKILIIPEGEYKRVDDYYMTIYDFVNKYRRKNTYGISLKHKDEIFIKKQKTGIAVDKETGKVKDEHLYSIQLTEFNDNNKNKWSYIVDYEINQKEVEKNFNCTELSLPKFGDLKLGGEGKIARYSKVNKERMYDLEDFFKERKAEDFIKVLLLKEVYFKGNIIELFNKEIELVGMSNSKPCYIGGYDMKTRKEKTMYKGFSAGTILLFENKMHSQIEYLKTALDKVMNFRNDGSTGKYVIV